MIDVLIGAAAALAGSGLTGWLQHRSTALAERATRRDRVVDAAGELSEALRAHREAQFTRIRLERDEADAEQQVEARWAAWGSQTRLNAALDRLLLRAGPGQLADAAEAAVDATVALWDERGMADWERLGNAARAAHRAFLNAAAEHAGN
ncbi:hypothetical protein [Streptomyces sp. 5-6(2022)]|uniref:hypothetical protein n=1 Tax=Streptomyces sp. 5-6(2022) TaxID=2936510 RepID=UPI0023B9DB66|nr:hypothetical protein [Streptomyces sp. 5-6(2022)]